MFEPIRKWWLSSRGQHTARLFAFELTVVMIGVLAAQRVSAWAQNRSALTQVESVHGDLFHSFSVYRAIAVADQVAVPCVQQRIETILHQTANRAPVDPLLLTPAPMMGMDQDTLSARDYQLLRERYGNGIADRIGSVEFTLHVVGESEADLNRRWFEFQRLNPLHGAVADADRSAARETAVQIMGDLSAIDMQSRAIINITRELGIAVSPGIKPVHSCQEMWGTGKGFVGN